MALGSIPKFYSKVREAYRMPLHGAAVSVFLGYELSQSLKSKLSEFLVPAVEYETVHAPNALTLTREYRDRTSETVEATSAIKAIYRHTHARTHSLTHPHMPITRIIFLKNREK